MLRETKKFLAELEEVLEVGSYKVVLSPFGGRECLGIRTEEEPTHFCPITVVYKHKTNRRVAFYRHIPAGREIGLSAQSVHEIVDSFDDRRSRWYNPELREYFESLMESEE